MENDLSANLPAPGLTDADFRMLFERHWDQVFSVCQYYVHDTDLASDLSQEVFMMVWKKRGMLVNDGRLLHYLLRSAKLEAMEYVRTRQNRQIKLDSLQNKLQQENRNFTEDEVIYQESQLQYEQFYSTLPAKSREIFELNQNEELDRNAIADRMNVSVKTVEHHLYKTIKLLKDKILKSL